MNCRPEPSVLHAWSDQSASPVRTRASQCLRGFATAIFLLALSMAMPAGAVSLYVSEFFPAPGFIVRVDEMGNQTAIALPDGRRPAALKLDPAGNLLVLSKFLNGVPDDPQVLKITPTNQVSVFSSLPPEYDAANYIYRSYLHLAVTADGGVFLFSNGNISPPLQPSQGLSEIWQLFENQPPVVLATTPWGFDLTAGPGGFLYLASGGRILRVTRTGEVTVFFDPQLPAGENFLVPRFNSQGEMLILASHPTSLASRSKIWKAAGTHLTTFLSPADLIRSSRMAMTMAPSDVLFLAASDFAGDPNGYIERLASNGAVTPVATLVPSSDRAIFWAIDDDAFDTFPSPFCGDGTPAVGESCDDGNWIDGDGCDSNCTPTACGNGIRSDDEPCDDGAQVSGDGCSAACQCESTCGNGIVELPCEQCDDSNVADGDGCESTCKRTAPVLYLSRFGNGDVVTVDAADQTGSPTPNVIASGLGRPGALTVDKDHNVFVIDYDSSRLLKITPTGAVSEFAGLPYGGQASYNHLTIASDGAVFLSLNADTNGCELWKLETGAWTRLSTGGCMGATVGPGGHVYQTVGHRVERVSRSGVVTTFFDAGPGSGAIFEHLRFNSHGELFIAAIVEVSFPTYEPAFWKLEGGTLVPFGDPPPGRLARLTFDATDTLYAMSSPGIFARIDSSGTAEQFWVDGNGVGGGMDDNVFDTFTGPVCGDAILAVGESCDDGNRIAGDGCSLVCACESTCGNGITEGPCEQCDDGNLLDDDGCDSNCQPSQCGNGVATGLEECDDGNIIPCDGCSSTCETEIGSACGDGQTSATCGEECDDGNISDGDGCSSTCQDISAAESVSQTVGMGGMVTTDTESGGDGATASDPIEVSVTAPGGGMISIQESPAPSGASTGFQMLGQQVVITATPPATSASPFVVVLRLDASRIPAGQSAASLQVSKDGKEVPGCMGAPMAVPDPCISNRATLGDGDVALTVLTSTASVWGIGVLQHDSVLLPPKPLSVAIPSGDVSVAARLTVKVRNADPSTREPLGHTIQLTALDGDCPAGTVSGTPVFRGGVGDSMVLAGGHTGVADVPLMISSAAFDSLNRKAPQRCRLTLSADAIATGNIDPTVSNNTTTVELSVVDANDPPTMGVAESTIQSIKSVLLKIPKNKASTTKKVPLKAGNAGGGATAVHVDSVAGNCPPGLIGDAGLSNGGQLLAELTVNGGASKSGKLSVTATGAAMSTPNHLAPIRCTAILHVRGANGDADVTNSETRVIIDVVDLND